MPHTNFDVSGLSDYVKENLDILIKNVTFGKGTRTRMSVQTGVKSSEHLHILDVDPIFGDGSDCGFENSGTAAISERLIECATLRVNLEICDKNLIGKYAEYLVKIGAGDKDLPFEEYLIEGLTDKINRKVEKLIWLGDKTLTTELKWIDGIIKIASDSVTASTGVIDVQIAAGSSKYAGIKAVYAAIPENAKIRGAEIYVSPAVFDAYMQDLVSANLYHYNPGESFDEYPLPGTSCKVVRTLGLEGSSNIFATFPTNMVFGTDLENDTETFDIWYSKDNRTNRIAVEFNAGVQLAFLDQCVLGTFN